MSHDNFKPPEDPGHDEWVREQQAEAHWEKQLTDAYAEGRKDEREEWASAICCGSLVADHGIGDGHSPVNMGDYHLSATIEAARAALAKAGN